MSADKKSLYQLSTFVSFNDAETDTDRLPALEDFCNLHRYNDNEDLTPSQRDKDAKIATASILDFLKLRQKRVIGYQLNLSEDYSRLAPALDMHINNIGDPFSDVGGFRLNTKPAERAILQYFAELWTGPKDPNPNSTLPQPCTGKHITYDPDTMDSSFFHSASGYVCSFGSTEANFWSLRQARDYLRGKFLFSKVYGNDLETKTNFGPLSPEQPHNSVKPFGSTDQNPIQYDFKRQHRYHPAGALIVKQHQKDDRESLSGIPVSNLSHPLQFEPDPSPHQNDPSDLENRHGTMFDSAVDTTNGLLPLIPSPWTYNNRGFHDPIILYPHSTHYSIGKIKDSLAIHTPDTFMKEYYQDFRRPGHYPRPSECFDYLQQLRHNDNIHDELDSTLTSENYLKVFGKDEFPAVLPIYEDGTMNLDALKFMVRFFFALGNPVIVVTNYGTTFTGAYDSVHWIEKVIKSTPGCHIESENDVTVDGINYIKMCRRNFYLHCDGALGAAYGAFFEAEQRDKSFGLLESLLTKHSTDPFVQNYLLRLRRSNTLLNKLEDKIKNNSRQADSQIEFVAETDAEKTALVAVSDITPSSSSPVHKLVNYQDITLPSFTFRHSSVMSISMSGHKFIGNPNPSGVAMTLRKYMLDFVSSGVTYISSPDTTISGSRSGLNILTIYDYLSRRSPGLEILKYWACYNTARLAAKMIATAINSTVLSIPRDKPQQYWSKSFDTTLEALQNEQLSSKSNWNQFPPLVRNFPGSLSIILPQPSFEIQDKFSLSCDTVQIPKRFGYNWDPEYVAKSPVLSYNPITEIYTLQCCHIFAMESLTIELIQELAADLSKDKQVAELRDAMIAP